MSALSDATIKHLAQTRRMIEPFESSQQGVGVVSYGCSSYGYDARLSSEEFLLFAATHSVMVDPKAFDKRSFVAITPRDDQGGAFVIPPHSFALGRTVERFIIPADVVVICIGKSTYARCGIIVNVTPLEPEWEGFVTIEIANTTPLPARIYPNEGIAQFVFLRGDHPPQTTYADRKGKYMNQTGVVLPKISHA